MQTGFVDYFLRGFGESFAAVLVMRRYSVICGAVRLLFMTMLLRCTCASIMGVDLGLAYVKVSVARPGKGLHLVLNEQSKRKTPSAVAFTDDGERLFGDAAIAYAGKAPHRAVLDGRSLVGECGIASEAENYLNCSRALVTVDKTVFNGEQIVAMLLGMARRQANAVLEGATIKDAVVTVPAWFDERHRAAVVDSARVLGMNCLGVVNANTAAAIKYALDGKARNDDRDLSSSSEATDSSSSTKRSGQKNSKSSKASAGKLKERNTQTVMFVDYGASGSTASIARITTDPKTGIATAVKMLGHSWKRDVGGRALDEIILAKMASDFDKQRGEDAAPSKSLPRVMTRLRKEAQRVREILSANTQTVINVPSLHDDIDFKSTVSRQEFEDAAASILASAVQPAIDVLAGAGLSLEDLDAVVPFGGTSRTPKFQELLCAKLGRSTLNKSINSDEAAVLGTAFFAASLSRTFRVRKMEIEDIYNRAVSAEVDRDSKPRSLFSGSKAKPGVQKVVVFKERMAKLPSKRTLQFKRNGNFSIAFYLEPDKSRISARFPDRTHYGTAKVVGAAQVLKKLKDQDRAKSITPQISVTVVIDQSGFLQIAHAESSVDEIIETERDVPIVESGNSSKVNNSETIPENDIEEDGGSDSKSSADDTSDDKDESISKSKIADDDISSRKDSNRDTMKPKTRKVKSTQTLVHRQPLSVSFESVPGCLLAVGMGAEDIESSKSILRALELADNDRQERAEALNSLEAFVLEKRSLVNNANEEGSRLSATSEKERRAFLSRLDEAEDWMYTEEAKKTAKLRSTLNDIKGLYSIMEAKSFEIVKRPQVVKSLRYLITTTADRIKTLRSLHESRGSQDLKPFDEVMSLIDTTEKWLAEKEYAQEQLPDDHEPTLTVADVEAKIEDIGARALLLARLEVPLAGTDDHVSKNSDSTDESTSAREHEIGGSDTNDSASSGPEESSKKPVLDVDGKNVDSDVAGQSEVHDEL